MAFEARSSSVIRSVIASLGVGTAHSPESRPGQTEDDTMTVQTFRELLARRPFQPFRLVMSGGQAYEVRHPETALLTRSDMLIGFGESEEGVPAEFKICSLLHVTTVEPLTASGPRQAS